LFNFSLPTSCRRSNSFGADSLNAANAVEVAQVEKKGVSEKFDAVGTIEAIEEITVCIRNQCNGGEVSHLQKEAR